MHGIVLSHLGHDVHILERHNSTLFGHGSGITAMENVQAFIDKYDTSKQPYAITSPSMQFINRKAEFLKVWNIVLQMTGWNTLYFRLRANFDGLQSDFSSRQHPSVAEEETQAHRDKQRSIYDQGKTVTDIKDTNGSLTVVFESADGTGSIEADLVIAADGPNSTVRRMMQPDLQREYVGYVAWRGTVLESDVFEPTKEVFKERLTYFNMNGSHSLA